MFPTAHYAMGGIPTDPYGRVIVPQGTGEEVVPGLYALLARNTRSPGHVGRLIRRLRKHPDASLQQEFQTGR